MASPMRNGHLISNTNYATRWENIFIRENEIPWKLKTRYGELAKCIEASPGLFYGYVLLLLCSTTGNKLVVGATFQLQSYGTKR